MSQSAIVGLRRHLTHLPLDKTLRDQAIFAAQRILLCPHEREWTQQEQELLARYCLWAAQRLEAIRQVSAGLDIRHPSEGNQEQSG
ncbi:MAG: hypothetical protein K9K64_02535 [Desulfohalobiaceae bacterium]|nr:hypothetical protein [Desulfohalobiaceae bacterium]